MKLYSTVLSTVTRGGGARFSPTGGLEVPEEGLFSMEIPKNLLQDKENLESSNLLMEG